MQFLDDSLHPENQDKVVITVRRTARNGCPRIFPKIFR